MFIGRKQELLELTSRINSSRFEMIPIYGRRRVGKTRLLEEFAQDQIKIFFTADQFGAESNLIGLSQAIYATITGSASVEAPVYGSFEMAFEAVATFAKQREKPVIFIIDEYPYLAKSADGISSVLQKVIDHSYLKVSNLMLILTGSQLSFMEEQVLGYESPLYGRRTGQIKLLPLSFKESLQFLPGLSVEEALTVYGLTGGIPLYLSMIDSHLSLKENILNNVLRTNSFLYEEPSNLLMQELRSPARYNDIIAAIAGGASDLSDIRGKTNLETGTLSRYIATLMDLNILEKRVPLTKIGKNKPIYVVKDGLFRFWYRYVPKYRNLLELGQGELIWPQIAQDLPLFTSMVFEEFCRDWLLRQNGTSHLNFLVGEVGSWWGKNPLIHQSNATQEEVDVIGIGIEKSDLVVGECKWRNERTDLAVGRRLVERANFFPYRDKQLILFSKSGFTDELKNYADEQGISLWIFGEMIEG